jgi:hypothetical protein
MLETFFVDVSTVVYTLLVLCCGVSMFAFTLLGLLAIMNIVAEWLSDES